MFSFKSVLKSFAGFSKDGKVHLIDLEKKLEVVSGKLEEIKVFKTEWGKIGVAICYDGFFDDVVGKLVKEGAEILVQPSANPEPWDERLEKEWLKGCWEMVQKYGKLKYGVNPMGVGKILDLIFEGYSNIVAKKEETRDGSGYLAKAKTKDREELIYAEINIH